MTVFARKGRAVVWEEKDPGNGGSAPNDVSDILKVWQCTA